MKRCPSCGAANGDSARFCIGCGARMDPDGGTAAATAAPPPARAADGAPIRFESPACRQHLAADPDMAGDSIACPQCGRTLVIPSVSQLAPSAPPSPAPPPPLPPGEVPAAPGPVASGAAVPDPAAGPGEAPVRRRPRLVGRVALAAVLVVALAWGSSVIVPGLLPGAVKRPPAGWVPHAHDRSDSIVFAPPDWTCPHRDEADRRLGRSFDPNEMMFLVGKVSGRSGSPLEEVVEIGFHGWRDTDGLHEMGPRRFLESKDPSREEIEKDGAAMLSRTIHKVAGGIASETVVESKGFRRRHVVLIAPNHAGASHLVHFVCQAEAVHFDRLDDEVFRPMIDSFLYCVDDRKARAVYRAAGVTAQGDGR